MPSNQLGPDEALFVKVYARDGVNPPRELARIAVTKDGPPYEVSIVDETTGATTGATIDGNFSEALDLLAAAIQQRGEWTR